MNTGRFILSQVLDLVHRQTLDRSEKQFVRLKVTP